METPKKAGFRHGRALTTFILAYVAITIVATGFSLALEKYMGVPGDFPPMQNPAYLLAERFIPILNLIVWTGGAWLYFKGRGCDAESKEVTTLGVYWLALAVVVDYVGFVLIKNPISLSPHDFYIGQFPWIYLIYLTVVASPWCCILLLRRGRVAVSA